MIDTNKLIFESTMAAFGNYEVAQFSTTYAGGTIAAGGFVGPIRATASLNNSNAVSHIQIQFTGLETFYRVLPGTFFVDYPNAVSANYQIECFSYFTGGNVVVDTYISNQIGTTVTIPAITFTCQAFLFVAPF